MGFLRNVMRGILTCVAMETLVKVPFPNVSGAPNIKLDTTRIYLPHELDDLLQAAAQESCMRDPNCNPNTFLGTHQARCSLGAGAEEMLSSMVNIRTDSVRRCNPFTGEVLWPATGECVTLLTQGPCPPGLWVKLTVPDLRPVCERRPCKESQALTASKCTNKQDESNCPTGMTLVNNEFGRGECDCNRGMAYHTLTQRCYKPYSQGPCPVGHVIKVTDSQTIGNAECFPNVCPEENMVMIDDNCQVQDFNSDARGTCYFLDTQGPCDSGILTIDDVLLEPLCLLQTEPHSIFNLPNIRGCPRGSIRDSQGRCRQDFSKIFGRPPPIVTSRPGTVNGTICPKGQLFLGGFCYRFPSRRGNNSRPTPSSPEP